MKVKISKTMMEPGAIPWENINQDLAPTEVEKLLDELLNNAGRNEVDMEELLREIDKRILENCKRLENLKRQGK